MSECWLVVLVLDAHEFCDVFGEEKCSGASYVRVYFVEFFVCSCFFECVCELEEVFVNDGGLVYWEIIVVYECVHGAGEDCCLLLFVNVSKAEKCCVVVKKAIVRCFLVLFVFVRFCFCKDEVVECCALFFLWFVHGEEEFAVFFCFFVVALLVCLLYLCEDEVLFREFF